MLPGDYLLSMTIDGVTHRQTLRVERASGSGASGFSFEVEEMLTQYTRWLRTQR